MTLKKCFLLLVLVFCAAINGQESSNNDQDGLNSDYIEPENPVDLGQRDNSDVETVEGGVEPAGKTHDENEPPAYDSEAASQAEEFDDAQFLDARSFDTRISKGDFGAPFPQSVFPFSTPDMDPDSRVAPNIRSQRGGIPYVITEARLREIRKAFMYWYYDQGNNDNTGDFQGNIQVSSPTIHKNLNFQLPFFGFRYNYTRVSLNGYLEFSDPPENYINYPLVFPHKEWPKKNDPAFIGIWHSRCRIGTMHPDEVNPRKPGVYFRLDRDLMQRIDQPGVEMRERVKWDVREGVIGAETFEPKHAITVTWKNVSFAGGISQALQNTNTFQMVLATDEVFTYAIFNYLDLQWTTHTEARGDTHTGEGGTPAYVGFNAGNGTRSYEYLPYSQSSVIRDLTGRGFANGFPGRHIFRIDENIMLGTCNKDWDDANLPLMIAPESGNMLGGTVVNITGPCFDVKEKVRCKFDVVVDEVEGTVINRNRAICIQPRLLVEGYINLEVSIGNGKFKWKGKYFVETPGSAAEKIFFDGNAVNEKYPDSIKLTWVKQNLTMNENSPVRISLWGYRERTIRPEFVYIDLIADGITNTGEYAISPAAYRNRDNYLFNDIKFGFIQINLTDSIPIQGNSDVTITPIIWSRPIPLGWYFAPQWEREHGENWPARLCDIWIKNDRYLKNFAHELHQCPCTLEQALNDKGRFLPDFTCDKDVNPTCRYNRGAVHCVRSGAPTLEGSEQQCCYDKRNFLMMSYDQLWGSTPFRSHNLGYLPWDEANKVPTLSQWFHDVVPKYLCCMWQDNNLRGETGEQSVGCETLRFERRPTQDCVAYQAPAVAGVFGDPHIVTFDNYEYTFNGLGEYVLVKVNNMDLRLDIQGRFEKMHMNAYGEVRATQLSAVVARGNSSTVIEVRTRPKEARWRYRLDVLADGKRIYFDRPSLKFQHFPGVLVYTPTYILNQSEVVIMFDSGAGLEVIENSGFLTMRNYLPWRFINQTRGLFGNWSFDMMDDLMTPDGQKVALVNNINDFGSLYKDFGQKWMLEDKDNPSVGRALFHRENGRTSSYYNNRTFEPEFLMDLERLVPPNRTDDLVRAKDLCYENYQCAYDYAMTLDPDLAHFTLNYHSSIMNIKDVNDDHIVSCGVLETPRFGRKSNFLFIPGTKVTFECNENFVLIGDQRRECTSEGYWNSPEYGYTECLRQQEYSQRTAGITTAIVLTVLVILIVVLAMLAYTRFKDSFRSRKEVQPIYMPSAKELEANRPQSYEEEDSLPSTIPSHKDSSPEQGEARTSDIQYPTPPPPLTQFDEVPNDYPIRPTITAEESDSDRRQPYQQSSPPMTSFTPTNPNQNARSFSPSKETDI